MSLAKGCEDVCESAALLKVPGATLGSEEQVKEKSLHLCVRTLGDQGILEPAVG